MRRKYSICLMLFMVAAMQSVSPRVPAAEEMPGIGLIDYAGYSDCIKLSNENTRVILGPHCGGRVLE